MLSSCYLVVRIKSKLPIFLFSIAVTLFFDIACILLEDLVYILFW